MQGLDIRATHVRGTSWLHRLDPIAKLAWILAVVLVAFATFDPIPLFAIAASIVVIQTLAPAACGTSCTPIAAVGPLTLYLEGMTRGLSLAGRVLAMEVVALGALMATHPSDLFAALARLRVPYLANFMIALTLQLVPVLHREVAVVLAAQRARGLKGTGFAAILPAFVPVFVGAFERVQRMAMSLESRGFGASGPRTSYRQVRSGPLDLAISALGLVAAVVGVVLGLTRWSAMATGTLDLSAAVVTGIFLVAAAIFAFVVGRAMVAVARS